MTNPLEKIISNLFESLTPVETELGPVSAESVKKFKELDARASELKALFDKRQEEYNKQLNSEFEQSFKNLDKKSQAIWDEVFLPFGIVEDDEPEGTKFAITGEHILVKLVTPVQPIGPIQ